MLCINYVLKITKAIKQTGTECRTILFSVCRAFFYISTAYSISTISSSPTSSSSNCSFFTGTRYSCSSTLSLLDAMNCDSCSRSLASGSRLFSVEKPTPLTVAIQHTHPVPHQLTPLAPSGIQKSASGPQWSAPSGSSDGTCLPPSACFGTPIPDSAGFHQNTRSTPYRHYWTPPPG